MKKKMFDFVIGNPPYQEDTENEGDRSNPIYNKFYDSAASISDSVELITPARFLFNAGQTPKSWNEKMLHNQHFKVIKYESDASKVFTNTEIKGGVAITYFDNTKTYNPIEVFSQYAEMNNVVKKVMSESPQRLNTIIASQGLYRFSELLFSKYPEVRTLSGKGTGNKIVSSIMEKLPEVFVDSAIDQTYVKFLGRINSKRVYKYIKRGYLQENEYIDKYNLFIPEANNSGHFGEILTSPEIGNPNEGATDTFLSAGKFESRKEAENFAKYLKCKFFRALLGVKKVTQHCPPSVWAMIPLQDFTSSSDIDWSVSIPEIDKQLYKKYGLSEEEISFIESNVKEMV